MLDGCSRLGPITRLLWLLETCELLSYCCLSSFALESLLSVYRNKLEFLAIATVFLLGCQAQC